MRLLRQQSMQRRRAKTVSGSRQHFPAREERERSCRIPLNRQPFVITSSMLRIMFATAV